MTSPISGILRSTGAVQPGASASMTTPGSFFFRRARSGWASSVSPIQFGATTRIFGTRGLSGPLDAGPCRRSACRSRDTASGPPSRRRGTPGDAWTTREISAWGNAREDRSRSPRRRGSSGRSRPSGFFFRRLRRFLLVHGREPVPVLGDLAGDHVEEQLLDLGRDRSARARADHAPVELADRRDLGRRAGEEGLVGDVDVVAGDAPGNDLVAELRRELDHRGARDARERRSQLRLVELSVLDEEEVLARALGDEAVHVEEQALVVAVLGRLEVREDRIRIGAGHL